MKIGIIMGGISSEREISIKSGESIFKNINKEKYDVVKIIIDEKEDIITKVKKENIDFALLALHGQFGEDGTVQAVLQAMGIKYSGCGPLSSAACMDKDMTKSLLKAEGIRTAKWINLKSIEELDYKKIEELGYPVFIKPTHGGSSVSTYFIKRKEEVLKAVEEGFKVDTEVMIEEFIKGEEITCPIIKDKVYPILAIEPTSEFFDFESKYKDGGAKEYIVQLDEELKNEVEDMALRTYKALKCSVYARVDFIVTKEKVPYILEVNTLPGMTENSLFPKSALGLNMSYSDLVDKIIEESLNEKR